MSNVIENEEAVVEEAEFDSDIFDSMVDGSFEPEEVEEENIGDDVEESADSDDSEYDEDTDQEDDSDEDEELDEDSDGDLNEDSDAEDEDEEEYSLVDDDDLDDEDSDAEGEDEDSDDEEDLDADEDADDESENDTDTEGNSDGEAPATDEVDYKAFYDAVVNTEFTVNGKQSKGFSDPKKIIQSMQMAGGFSEKMAGFKQYRPFMSPLKERGMLEDKAKFDLAMNIIDGDKEAIKQHLSTLDIDPLDLDMEAIKYDGRAATASSESLVVEDALERARGAGMEDKFRNVIGKDWDQESFQEFVGNSQVREDLLNHMESGAFDNVQNKMSEMSRLDYNGSFGNMSSINKYRAAVTQLQQEAPVAAPTPAQQEPVAKEVPKTPSVKDEKAKIAKGRKEEAYKKKVATRNAQKSEERRKASSMSKRKAGAKPKAKFDPMKVEGQELDDLMDQLIAGGR